MQNTDKISELIKSRLSADLRDILTIAVKIAIDQNQNLYMVGGIVRDLLLGRSSLDLDLVVEGDAIDIAKRFAEIVQGNVTVHTRFLTATVKYDERSVDFVTARSETYSRPGVLPIVKAGNIDDDLFRRDFTINSMAVNISSGELSDPYNGREDIGKRLLRILHGKSFIDDATRIWRALRYEQRLSFRLESDTLRLLKRDLDMLDTISSDRIRHEIELVLKEEFPEKVIHRAAELGVLKTLHPSLVGDDWINEKFGKARELRSPDSSSPELSLALLAYRLNTDETEELIGKLGLRKLQTQILRDVSLLKGRLNRLSGSREKPSKIYELLHGFHYTALIAVSIAGSLEIQKMIDLYLNKLRNVRTVLTGKDLENMGIKPGPHMKEILYELLQARLNGQVTDKQGEIEMVNNTLQQKSN